MKKWLVAIVVVLCLLVGYVASGPYLALRAIRHAVIERDAAELANHIHFPALRGSLKAQLNDRIVRSAGSEAQSSVLGAMGLRLAQGFVDGAVETLVTPAGIGALMEGHAVWNRIDRSLERPDLLDPQSAANLESAPLRFANRRYESLSRFTATLHDENGSEIVFVLTRDGIDWKLSDIRLPI